MLRSGIPLPTTPTRPMTFHDLPLPRSTTKVEDALVEVHEAGGGNDLGELALGVGVGIRRVNRVKRVKRRRTVSSDVGYGSEDGAKDEKVGSGGEAGSGNAADGANGANVKAASENKDASGGNEVDSCSEAKGANSVVKVDSRNEPQGANGVNGANTKAATASDNKAKEPHGSIPKTETETDNKDSERQGANAKPEIETENKDTDAWVAKTAALVTENEHKAASNGANGAPLEATIFNASADTTTTGTQGEDNNTSMASESTDELATPRTSAEHEGRPEIPTNYESPDELEDHVHDLAPVPTYRKSLPHPRPPPLISLPPTPFDMEDFDAREACAGSENPTPPQGIPKPIPTLPRSSSCPNPSPLRTVSLPNASASPIALPNHLARRRTTTTARASSPSASELSGPARTFSHIRSPPPPPRHRPAQSIQNVAIEFPPAASPQSPTSSCFSTTTAPDIRAGLTQLVTTMAADDLRAELAAFVDAMSKRKDIVLETARLQAVADVLASELKRMGDGQWEEALRPMRRFVLDGEQGDAAAAAALVCLGATAAPSASASTAALVSPPSTSSTDETLVERAAKRQSFRATLSSLSAWKPIWMEGTLDEREEKGKRAKNKEKDEEKDKVDEKGLPSLPWDTSTITTPKASDTEETASLNPTTTAKAKSKPEAKESKRSKFLAGLRSDKSKRKDDTRRRVASLSNPITPSITPPATTPVGVVSPPRPASPSPSLRPGSPPLAGTYGTFGSTKDAPGMERKSRKMWMADRKLSRLFRTESRERKERRASKDSNVSKRSMEAEAVKGDDDKAALAGVLRRNRSSPAVQQDVSVWEESDGE